jgi:hypothetical protein
VRSTTKRFPTIYIVIALLSSGHRHCKFAATFPQKFPRACLDKRAGLWPNYLPRVNFPPRTCPSTISRYLALSNQPRASLYFDRQHTDPFRDTLGRACCPEPLLTSCLRPRRLYSAPDHGQLQDGAITALARGLTPSSPSYPFVSQPPLHKFRRYSVL